MNSKKLWFAISTVVAILCAALAHQVLWAVALKEIVAVAFLYIGVQGVLDFADKFIPKGAQPVVNGIISAFLDKIAAWSPPTAIVPTLDATPPVLPAPTPVMPEPPKPITVTGTLQADGSLVTEAGQVYTVLTTVKGSDAPTGGV